MIPEQFRQLRLPLPQPIGHSIWRMCLGQPPGREQHDQGCIKPGHGACHAYATLDLACNFRAQYVFLNYLGQTALVFFTNAEIKDL